jgi:hypothetical protein
MGSEILAGTSVNIFYHGFFSCVKKRADPFFVNESGKWRTVISLHHIGGPARNLRKPPVMTLCRRRAKQGAIKPP